MLQNPHVFLTFDSLAPATQKRHLNVQKCSELHFWLWNVLHTTTACTFSTSPLPKVVREWCALYILTWKRASCHNGVQFVLSHLATWLRTRRFSEPNFWPSAATNHWKNIVDRDFATFSRTCIILHLLSSDSFSSLIFSFLLFSSLALPTSAFPSIHIVGNLTSKLPSKPILNHNSSWSKPATWLVRSSLAKSLFFLMVLQKSSCSSEQLQGNGWEAPSHPWLDLGGYHLASIPEANGCL